MYLDPSVILFGIAVGLIAQLVDGALGMAYGVTGNSVLLGMGFPPAIASASIHTSEIFTTLTSGVSHLKFGNVDRRLVKRLLLSGMFFGGLGAYVCASVPGDLIKPFIAAYLLIIGVFITLRVFGKVKIRVSYRKIPIIGAVGGFLDAIGGGGWGPICTSTLTAGGHNPRFTIGSVNLTEFFVTVVEALVFFAILGLAHVDLIIGLIIGGVAMAPLAAFTCKKIPARLLTIIVGLLIIGLSVRTMFMAIF